MFGVRVAVSRFGVAMTRVPTVDRGVVGLPLIATVLLI